MPLYPDSDAHSVDLLRKAAEVRTSMRGLRATAREIGMSTSGLSAFLEGTRPQPATSRRLTVWFMETGWKAMEGHEAEILLLALTVLVKLLPSHQQEETRQKILALLRDLRPAPRVLAHLPPIEA